MGIYSHIFFKILTIQIFILNVGDLYSQSCQGIPTAKYNFQDIKGILDNNKCNNCHHGGNLNFWNYEQYDNLFIKDKCGNPLVSPNDLVNSSLLDKLNGGSISCGQSMPLGGNPITPSELLAIESWIQYGAPEFCVENFETIKEILNTNKCNSCHYGGSNLSPWHYETYDDALKNSSNCGLQNVIKYNAASSLLYQKIVKNSNLTCGNRMYKEGEFVDDLSVAKIRDWINGGAPQFFNILPVTLSFFDVKKTIDAKIIISWATLAEINTSHFIVQHSPDGRSFTDLGTMDAQSSLGSTYHFEANIESIGFHYFRLKIVDLDQNFSISQVRVVRLENKEEIFRITPNILIGTNHIGIEWFPTNGREVAKVKIMDILGNEYYSARISIGHTDVNLPNLLPGIYYMVLSDFTNHKLVKHFVYTQ